MWKILLDILLHSILTSPVIIIAIRWGSNSRKWTSFNHRQSLHLVPHGPSVKEEILEETYCSTEMKWILTQSIFQEYTSTSRFFMCSVCVCVRACMCMCIFLLPTPLPWLFLLYLQVQAHQSSPAVHEGGGGEEQSHNFLITAPSPMKNTAAAHR